MKYELIINDSITVNNINLFRIKALKSFSNVGVNELGGYIQSEKNLSNTGNAWVYDNAWVSGDARVSGDAQVYGNARVYGDAWVYGNARVYGGAQVSFQGEFITIGQFGDNYRYLTISKKDIINAGCFSGNFSDFKKAVTNKYGSDYGAYKNAIIIIENYLNKKND